MSLVLDTHFVVSVAGRLDDLTDAEESMLGSLSVAPFVSAVSLWELRIKWRALDRFGRRKGPIAPRAALNSVRELGFRILAMSEGHAAHELTPPLEHKDPFDDLLLSQAQFEGLKLLTRDAQLLKHPVAISASHAAS